MTDFTFRDQLIGAGAGAGAVIVCHIMYLAQRFRMAGKNAKFPPWQSVVGLLGAWAGYVVLAGFAAWGLDAHSRMSALYEGMSGPTLFLMLAHHGLDFFEKVSPKSTPPRQPTPLPEPGPTPPADDGI